MNEELTAHAENHTWSIVPLLAGKQAIGCRWIFKTKFKSDGSIDQHKTHLVA
jgi:histone deacetylase 1/2